MIQPDSVERTVLSGWALDAVNGKPWDSIILKADNIYVTADKMVRTDVAEMLADDSFEQCGFHFDLDSEMLRDAENIRIIFINYHEKSCYIQKIKY